MAKSQWNDDLRRRQQSGDVGFLGRSGRRYTGRKPLYFALAVALLGLVLIYASPLPGLGVFVFIGGVFAAFNVFVMSWLGR